MNTQITSRPRLVLIATLMRIAGPLPEGLEGWGGEGS
jgi:hypothetical protein